MLLFRSLWCEMTRVETRQKLFSYERITESEYELEGLLSYVYL